MSTCKCTNSTNSPKLIVITGGPGAGKTAALELARKHFCEHVVILPEADTILFQGGFFRNNTDISRKAGQRAIFHIQKELENVVLGEKKYAIGLCDRGTIDGLAYWNGSEEECWREVGSTLEAELAKYTAVIHLRTPGPQQGYNHSNPYRIESALEAAIIDQKISLAWQKHPLIYIIESESDFVSKVTKTLDIIKKHIPACCQ